MSQAQQFSSQSPEPDEAQLKNLANLHRMSRTAGLGTTDYAAVNVPAVVTLVIGLASVLAFATPIFLFIPVIGVLIGIIAVRQLRASNGTQTGMTLAAIGLVACVACSAITGFLVVKQAADLKKSNQEKTELIANFGKAISQEKFDEAYQMLDPRFRDRVSKEKFRDFFEKTVVAGVGKITSLKSNEAYVEEQATDDPSMRMAGSKMILDAEKLNGQTIRYDVVYRYSGDAWKIYNIPQWFPAEKSGAQSGPPGPG